MKTIVKTHKNEIAISEVTASKDIRKLILIVASYNNGKQKAISIPKQVTTSEWMLADIFTGNLVRCENCKDTYNSLGELLDENCIGQHTALLFSCKKEMAKYIGKVTNLSRN